jgi:hypothetical protein
LSFSNVFEPRLQLAHNERRRERVQVPFDRCVCDTEGARKLERVPELPAVVGNHRPEAPERDGINANT